MGGASGQQYGDNATGGGGFGVLLSHLVFRTLRTGSSSATEPCHARPKRFRYSCISTVQCTCSRLQLHFVGNVKRYSTRRPIRFQRFHLNMQAVTLAAAGAPAVATLAASAAMRR